MILRKLRAAYVQNCVLRMCNVEPPRANTFGRLQPKQAPPAVLGIQLLPIMFGLRRLLNVKRFRVVLRWGWGGSRIRT